MYKFSLEELPTAVGMLHNKVDEVAAAIKEKPALDDLLNSNQIRVFFGSEDEPLPEATLRLWTRKSPETGFPVRRIGKRVFALRSDLITWVGSHPTRK